MIISCLLTFLFQLHCTTADVENQKPPHDFCSLFLGKILISLFRVKSVYLCVSAQYWPTTKRRKKKIKENPVTVSLWQKAVFGKCYWSAIWTVCILIEEPSLSDSNRRICECCSPSTGNKNQKTILCVLSHLVRGNC